MVGLKVFLVRKGLKNVADDADGLVRKSPANQM